MATRKASNSFSRKMPDLPTRPEEVIPFTHSAAGHPGISTDSSGSVLIKPCTQAEIDFYQSATNPRHKHFNTHMPKFMGQMGIAPNQEALKALLEQQNGVAPVTAIQAEPYAARLPGPLPSLLSRPATTTSLSVKRISGTWKPSGGKKLETGLGIMIENAAAGLHNPCILDVKLGARLWDDDAPAAKRQKLDDVAEVTTSGSLGFRVAGMKVWLGAAEDVRRENLSCMPEISRDQKHLTLDQDGYVGYDKLYGRMFNKDNVKDAFITYLGGQDKEGKLYRKYAKMIRGRLVVRLEAIESALKSEESRMYSASILMVYEGNDVHIPAALRYEEDAEKEVQDCSEEGAAEDEVLDTVVDVAENGHIRGEGYPESADASSDESEEVPPKVCEIKLIDFAHARWTPRQGPDENALQGIKNVIRILKEID